MEILYNNSKIDLATTKCDITDNLCGKADSLTICFSDIKHECRQWQFKKNDAIEIFDNDISLGKMYVDSFGLDGGTFRVKALSLKKKYKTKHTRTWEKTSFLDIANDCASQLGLKLETYGVTDYKYERVDQKQQNDIDFLYYRCQLEGYSLKVGNDKLIIISDEFLLKFEPIAVSSAEILDNPKFKCTSNSIYGGCEISSFLNSYVKGRYIENIDDEILRINDIPVDSIEQANRFAKNIFHMFNKNEYTGSITIDKNSEIAAGNIIKLSDYGSFNGLYIAEKVTYRLIQNRNFLNLRRINS